MGGWVGEWVSGCTRACVQIKRLFASISILMFLHEHKYKQAHEHVSKGQQRYPMSFCECIFFILHTFIQFCFVSCIKETTSI